MNIKNNPLLIILTTLAVGLILTTGNAYGYIAANGAGIGYCDPAGDPGCEEDKSGTALSMSYAPIESYIEEGGGYFLNAFSTLLSMSNRVEMTNLAGIDRGELQQIVNQSLENITRAKYTYSLLIRAAEETPYNPDVLLKLKNFDYRGFMTRHSLNSVIFKEVEAYLQKGDITGIFKRVNNGFLSIEKLLLSIKTKTDLKRVPELSDIWKINEEASDTLIFGQYVARIFSELSE